MFIGSLETINESHVDYPAEVKKALQYLREHDFVNMEDGSYKISEYSTANVQRYATRVHADCRPETHRKYVDIQYMVEGEEYMGWCPLSPDLKITQPYDEKKDIEFYESLIPDSNILLSSGYFAVLYPEDVHSPQGAVDDIPSNVTKVVVKIAVDSL